jgi:hypothetical protein
MRQRIRRRAEEERLPGDVDRQVERQPLVALPAISVDPYRSFRTQLDTAIINDEHRLVSVFERDSDVGVASPKKEFARRQDQFATR